MSQPWSPACWLLGTNCGIFALNWGRAATGGSPAGLLRAEQRCVVVTAEMPPTPHATPGSTPVAPAGAQVGDSPRVRWWALPRLLHGSARPTHTAGPDVPSQLSRDAVALPPPDAVSSILPRTQQRYGALSNATRGPLHPSWESAMGVPLLSAHRSQDVPQERVSCGDTPRILLPKGGGIGPSTELLVSLFHARSRALLCRHPKATQCCRTPPAAVEGRPQG